MSVKLLRRRFIQLAGAASAMPRVAAAARVAELNCLIVGDWGRQGAWQQREVGAQMGRTASEIQSRFVISVGDNFYEDGVSAITDPHWANSFEAIYSAPSLQTPWHVILGNHDYRGNVQAQLDYSARSARWKLPARYYQRREITPDGASVDLFFIDTNPLISAYRGTKVRIDDQDTNAQMAWLDSALGGSTAAWKIVIGHHPIYTVAGNGRDQADLIARLLPVLRAHNVAVYINGHDHNLQHKQIEAAHFITTGAGSRTSRVKVAATGEFSSDRHGFMTVALSRESFGFSFVTEAGQTVYQGRISRPA